jgi:hypothetical protein
VARSSCSRVVVRSRHRLPIFPLDAIRR